ncbi:hypothetical protein FJU10_11075 [Enterococcus sp. OL5]|nr:hypothetical protein FJU10_11075 [Enterococcus sp. OL5]
MNVRDNSVNIVCIPTAIFCIAVPYTRISLQYFKMNVLCQSKIIVPKLNFLF